MLVKATLEDIAKYGDLAYDLSLNPAKSSYPTYGDGIKTREDFMADAERAVTKETSELLLFVENGTVEGWMAYFWIPEDGYLQLSGCNLNRGTERALTELLELLERRFAGYTTYFGYPGENRDAIRFLQTHGFRCIEEAWNHSFFFDGYGPQGYGRDVEKISRNNFDKFRAVYHPSQETYWNCGRILETIDDWTIFVYNKDDGPVAAVFLQGKQGYFEIYGMEFAGGAFQEDAFRKLLTASLDECKHVNAKFMTYFCGEEEKRILAELGFQCVGQYVLYSKALSRCGMRT